MTIQESAQVVYMIHTAYPADRKATAEELADRIDLWAVFFADYTAPEFERAVKAWILSQAFMPTPKEIKEACDIFRRLGQKLAGAHFIPHAITDTDKDPETEKWLETLWQEIQETANEVDL